MTKWAVSVVRREGHDTSQSEDVFAEDILVHAYLIDVLDDYRTKEVVITKVTAENGGH